MTERATGGIVSVGQPVVIGEHGCSLTMPPRRGRMYTGSFRVEIPAETVNVLEWLVETLGGPVEDER